MPEWRKHGLLAITSICKAEVRKATRRSSLGITRAIAPDGSLRPEYMARLKRILDKADELGMAVILGIFYFGQDERVKDEEAVKPPSTTQSTGCWIPVTGTY